jgi:calcium-translocating P-type ATPase
LPRGGAEELERRLLAVPGVRRASASSSTRNLLVQFDESATDWAAIVRALEGPPPPAPREPSTQNQPRRVDPAFQSVARLAGAGTGLGFLTARQLLGRRGPPSESEAPFLVAAVLSVAEGVPPLRRAVRGLIGERPAALVLGNVATVAQTVAGKTMSLAVAAGAAVRAITAERARAESRRAYGHPTDVRAGRTVRLRAGDRIPTAGVTVDGCATVTGPSGLPQPLTPGARAPAGGRIHGGSITVALAGAPPARPRASPGPSATVNHHYSDVAGVLAIGAAVAAGVLTRSSAAALVTLQLLSARAAAHARQSADHGAVARAARGGAAVVAPSLRAPEMLVVAAPRLLTGGLEVVRAQPLTDDCSASDVLRLAGEVSTAAGSPWGRALPAARVDRANDVSFDGITAAADLHGTRYELTPAQDPDPGTIVLRLTRAGRPAGLIVLRPRLAPAALELAAFCRRRNIVPALLCGADGGAAAGLAERAGMERIDDVSTVAAVQALQGRGARVAVLDDSIEGNAAFAAAALGIALVDSPGEPWGASADVLVPNLAAVTAVLDAGARAGAAERDGTLLAIAANAAGVVWALRGTPTIRNGTRYVTWASAGALLASFWRLAGGARQRSVMSRLTDPRPERWGRIPVEEVLTEVRSSEQGLSFREAARRRVRRVVATRRGALAAAFSDQLRSPATAVLGAGAALSLSIGAVADVAMIAGVVVANTLIEAWQQSRARSAAEALEHLTAAEARVLRNGVVRTVPADDVVVGDVLVLASGDHVPADARVLSAQGLQVDEAALTGESMPVGKSACNGDEASRIVLHGSDVTVGTGRAVAVAVGVDTRLGSIAAALDAPDDRPSPLAVRLEQMMRQGLPIVAAAGAVVAAAGVLRGRPLASQLPIGASIAIAAVPEGLQLLASVASAGAARRLASRHALVRTLSAVDALGRVDVACADKTGTLTFGRPAVRVVADFVGEAAPAAGMEAGLEAVLRAGAVASPHPDASDAEAHPTDVAVTRAAVAAGLGAAARVSRGHESSFDPERAFHAARADGRLCAKGAVEALASRCVAIRRSGEDHPLGDAGILLERAAELARRGLRVLMVAEGPPGSAPDDPRELVALGFLGIADPLRPGVRGAVRRCHASGVRVMMLTGDHSETALAIAREAGLANGREPVLTGPEIAELEPEELDRRLDEATVVARITPIDKLRIVESLQRRGHTVAMTGDGVNDAPALRLADVGVAMGRHGTEVARQAADMILTEDDFSVLTEALVEGRSFWRNLRRALGLLLGGNLGEVGLVLGAAVLGLPAPLTARQILAVNLVTDVLPAVGVAIQPPEHRNLAALAREGTEALDRPLRRAIGQRAFATAVPSLAAYAVASRRFAPDAARSVAFGAICATQLALTSVEGAAGRGLSRPVRTAVLTTGAVLGGALTLPPARAFLGFGPLGITGWVLILVSSAGTAILARSLAAREARQRVVA